VVTAILDGPHEIRPEPGINILGQIVEIADSLSVKELREILHECPSWGLLWPIASSEASFDVRFKTAKM
jgi:hypothetical protein